MENNNKLPEGWDPASSANTPQGWGNNSAESSNTSAESNEKITIESAQSENAGVPKKSNAGIIALIVALVVLISVGIFGFMHFSGDDESDETPVETSAETTTAETTTTATTTETTTAITTAETETTTETTTAEPTPPEPIIGGQNFDFGAISFNAHDFYIHEFTTTNISEGWLDIASVDNDFWRNIVRIEADFFLESIDNASAEDISNIMTFVRGGASNSWAFEAESDNLLNSFNDGFDWGDTVIATWYIVDFVRNHNSEISYFGLLVGNNGFDELLTGIRWTDVRIYVNDLNLFNSHVSATGRIPSANTAGRVLDMNTLQ
jgi:hypothetical protein